MKADVREHQKVNSQLLALNTSLWEEVVARKDKISGKQISVPPFTAAKKLVRESVFGDEFTALQHLQRAIGLARAGQLGAVTDQFVEVLADINWSQNPGYTEENCDPNFLDGYAYAAISGPEGPVHCDEPRGGLFLMAPGVTYKEHKHPSKEVYLVLTPGVQWRLDYGDWFNVNPGDLIFHDSWQVHSMRTTDEPLLAFAGWTEAGTRLDVKFSTTDQKF